MPVRGLTEGPLAAITRKPRKRIALFTGNYVNVVDGVALTLNRLVAFLEAQGHRVMVFAPKARRARLQPAGTFISVPSIPIPGRAEYRLAWGLGPAARQHLERFEPDLVHVATPDLLGIGAQRWAISRNVPVVASYHTHFLAYLRYYGLQVLFEPMRRYIRWFYARCDRVLVPTAPLMHFFASLGILDERREWGRGVDRGRFHPGWRSDRWRASMDIREDDVLVTYVGRLVREKCVGVVASVLERLGAEGLRVRGMFVGDGPLLRPLRERLPEAVFTGHLSDEALSRAYASSDVFLCPSDSEAFGNVIVEAMASGLPVVGAGDSGSSRHVVDKVTGFVVGPGDEAGFYGRTRALVVDPDTRRSMGKAGVARAAGYDWDVVLHAAEAYYDEVVESHVGIPRSVVRLEPA